MAESSKTGLSYGQFDHAVYDHSGKVWQFARSNERDSALRILGKPKIVIESTSIQRPTTGDGDEKDAPSVRREQQIKHLTQAYPEAQPANTILAEFARASEAVDRAASVYDPSKGSLLAVAKVTDEAARRHAPLAAFPSGPTGSDLRLVQMQKQRRGWDDSHDAWLEVPTLHGEETTWKGPGVPIQSVIFASPFKRGDAYLGVRLITQTLIFKPVLKKAVLSSGSRLHENLHLSLDIKSTGGLPHADFAFNPWFTRQFAVIDQASSWSVWELSRRSKEEAKQLARGALSRESSKAMSDATDDGWGRITWVCDSTTVAVCNRRTLSLLDISDEGATEPQDIDVGIANGIGWILDISLLSSRPDVLCVLTPTSILLFRVERNMHTEVTVKTIMTLRHFRNTEDVSLCLHVLESENDLFLLMCSNISPTVFTYTVNFFDEDRITVSDPAELEVPVSYKRPGFASSITGLHSETLGIVRKRKADGKQDTASRYMAQKVRFYSIISLMKDFSVRQTLYCTPGMNKNMLTIKPPSWESAFPKSAQRLRHDDDFIVDDEDLDPVEDHAFQREPVSTYLQRRKLRMPPRSGEEWTVNHELTVQQLNDFDVAQATDFTYVLEQTRTALESNTKDEVAPTRTLQELAVGEVSVGDIEEASRSLEGLCSIKPVSKKIENGEDFERDNDGVEGTPRLALQSLALPPVLDVPSHETSERLSAFRDSIVGSWISPDAHNIPESANAARQQLVLNMAAEMTLASQVIRVKDTEEQQPTQSQSQTWELPVRPPTAPSSRATPSVYYDASSQRQTPALPTPSASAPASTVTESSHPSSFAATEIARLSRYTTFTAKTVPPVLPRRLQRVLAHWKPGTDPSIYDWLATSRHHSQWEDEAEDEGMTEKERRRMQKRTERYVRRQRREAEESQRQQALSSQAPGIISASQPQQRTTRAESQRAAGSSQQNLESSQLPVASQLLPGKHGGRPPPKKKRKSGF
ncbi:hypothetical protein LTR37_000662 [Vermiconidia calcicola]|uniref:Uncharacterized protein n=1 Tax=Vermiconidia calcicola TaxID=1690605 RepID=A0ACC3NYB5_9PEZI|nr:hypothetical protein LTR37_000662 [Vermiconidia calcicola]